MSLDLIFKHKKFSPLVWTQFLGALNDNYLKNALVVLLTFKGISLWGMDTKSLVAFASGIFILPFFLFSSISGQLSDKFQKIKIIRFVKWMELAIMVVACAGFFSHHYELLLVSLFFMGLHSTLFGPVKYSIIPELLPEDKLTAGNAYVEVGTFLAILIGTIAGGLSVASENGAMIVSVGLVLISSLGIISCYLVPRVAIADKNLKIDYNPIPQIWKTMKIAFPQKAVFNSIIGISWFWFIGAAILSILPVYTKEVLFGGEQVITLFLAVFTVGIAIGAVVCEKLSYDRVEIGLVPFGSLGLTLFLVDLAFVSSNWAVSSASELLNVRSYFEQPGSIRICVDLLLFAVSGGVFTVPLYTLIQQRSEREIRSRIIASNNILNALFMVVSSLLVIWFYHLKMTIPEIYFTLAIINLVAAVYIYSVVPEFTLRFFSWILSRLMYRLKVVGHSNIPKEGPAVLVCNHVSFADWLIILAAVKRPVRFVMYYKFGKIPLLRYLFKHAKVIPIAGKTENPKIFEKAFEIVSEELNAGEIVCIFPEGEITKSGEIETFRKGIEHILEKNPVPVVPMALKGLWGSMFSRKGGTAFLKLPRKYMSRVELHIGQAVPPQNANAKMLEDKVKNLMPS